MTPNVERGVKRSNFYNFHGNPSRHNKLELSLPKTNTDSALWNAALHSPSTRDHAIKTWLTFKVFFFHKTGIIIKNLSRLAFYDWKKVRRMKNVYRNNNAAKKLYTLLNERLYAWRSNQHHQRKRQEVSAWALRLEVGKANVVENFWKIRKVSFGKKLNGIY